MKIHSFCLKKCSAALFLIGKLTLAEAITLGALQGSAILGRPLDVTATVQLAAGESTSELCLEGAVTQGDSRDSGSRVRVIGESSQTPGQIRVRITSSGPLVEPVVNVELRAGCKQSLSRQYVLLADLEVEPNAVPLVSMESDRGRVVVAGSEVGGTASGAAKAAIAAADGPVQNGQNKPSTVPKVASKVATVKPAGDSVRPKKSVDPVVVKSPAAPAADNADVSKSAKLKLSASQVLTQRSAELKLTPQLQQMPSENSTTSAQASALWKASNLPVEDVAAESKRIAEFQSDIKTLRGQVQNNEKLLLEMQTALVNAQSGRVDIAWLYLLGFGFVASSGAGVWLWRRQQGVQAQPLWQAAAASSVRSDAPATPHQLPVHNPPEEMAQEVEPLPEVPQAAVAVDIDLDIYDSITNPPSEGSGDDLFGSISKPQVRPELVPEITPPVVSSPSKPLFAPSAYAGLRVATVEELFDIRQQAEFFVSLGQYDQAIQILRDCIGETEEARPIAYLDLLEIYHTLGRRRDFDACVVDFNQIFSGRIPSFENFKVEGRGIDSYSDHFSHIESSWVTSETLEMIESLIFVNPQDQSQTYFDLAAFNDLLLLHSVAKRVLGAEAGFVDTNRAALIKNPFVNVAGAGDASSPASPQVPAATAAAVDQKHGSTDSNLIDFDFVLPDEK